MKIIFLLFLFQSWARGVNCQGSLVMIGGNLSEDNVDVWRRMVNLSSEEGEARIGVITAANPDPAYWAEYYVQLFQRYGAEAVWIPVSLEDPHSPYSQDNVRMVQTCSGLFLGGGDPWRLAMALMEFNEEEGGRVNTPVLAAVKTRLEAGAMVAGTSAGIEALSDSVIVTGGYSWEALTFGASVASNGSDTRNLTYDPLGGLAVVNNILIDAHFRAKARQGRLTRLLADTRTSERAMGVDEDTALVCDVRGDVCACEIVGSGGVWIVDSPVTCQETNSVWSCRDVNTSFLTQNDLLTLAPDYWTSSFADWKDEVLGGGEETPHTTEDIFGTGSNGDSEYEYDRVVNSLLLSGSNQTFGRTRERHPRGYKLTFKKVPGKTEAAVYQPVGQQNFVLSYKYLFVDFTIM